MKEEAVTDALLRQFLLGRLEDEERQRQRIESLFITDSRTKERVLAAEQELIDDYLEDRLSTADREAFLSLYADTVGQRRKLRIAKSIQDWAANQPDTTPVDHGRETSVWDRLRPWVPLKPVLVIPIAITTVVAIVIAVVWLNSRNERHRQYLAVQQELAGLNTPSSLREVPSQIVLTLKPGSGRSLDPQSELKIQPDSSVAELRLLLMQKEDYPTYEAVVRRPRDDQPYTIPNLTAATEDGKFIRVRLPAHMLTRGTHQIELSGVAADGAKSPPEVYSLTVSE
jgi:hypothetical protein